MISFYLLFARGYWVGMPVGKRAGVSGLLATGAGMPGITELNLFLNLIRAGNSLQETQLSVNLFKGLWRCKMLYANLSPPLLFYSSVKNRRANTCVRTCVCASKELQPHVVRLINSTEGIQREIYRAWHSHMLTVKRANSTPGLGNL